MKKIAVVVPFFQRDNGILQRCLQSVFAQRLPGGVSVQIVVVDDESPVPLHIEIEGIDVPDGVEVVALFQRNGGPGSARNHALEAIDPARFEFVAFLDSDDRWEPTHLADALDALGQDADYYFCDHDRFDTSVSWFSERSAQRRWIEQSVAEPLGHADAYRIDGPRLLEGMVGEYLSQTSTVVYRYARHSALRFRPDLRNAGEDHLFWIELCDRSRTNVFSMRRNVYCGSGVNVYYSALDWASPAVVLRYGYPTLFRVAVAKRVNLSPEAFVVNDEHLARAFRAYSFLFFRSIARGHAPNVRLLARIIAAMPRRSLSMPFQFLSALRTYRTEAHTW